MFSRIGIQNWRQFENVEIEFHEKLTILTGANGAGKTTILNFLNRHIGWNFPIISTPKQAKEGFLSYFSDLWQFRNLEASTPSEGSHQIGSINYSNGQAATLTVPRKVGHAYQVEINGAQSLKGVFIPSHRPIYIYEPVNSIPTKVSATAQLLDSYMNEVRSRYSAKSKAPSASLRIKEALVSLATFGYGNQAVVRNQEAIDVFESFENVLMQILPESLGFKKIIIRIPEVVLDTTSGEFSFDALSGGVSAIIDMAWQIHMASQVFGNFIVVIDEPENHLHPTLQKTLLPNFLKAFPRTQMIVATHNPLMVSSVPESNVYVLNYNNETVRRVRSTRLDLVNRAGSSNEILREVLGLEHTKPIWVEKRIDALVQNFAGEPIGPEQLRRLKQEMEELGLGHLFPETISRVLSSSNDSPNQTQ